MIASKIALWAANASRMAAISPPSLTKRRLWISRAQLPICTQQNRWRRRLR